MVFELNEVSFSWVEGRGALEDVSLRIPAGKRVAVIGANGSGKSTLLTLLDGLAFAQKGSVKAFGEVLTAKALRDVERQRAFRRRIGYVFQNSDAQLFCPTVREDLEFGPLQLGVEEGEVSRRVLDISRRLGLEALLDRPPHELSLGEKKKAALASTLTLETEVLLLDEPTAGIDPQTIRDLVEILQEAHVAGRTIVFATHDLHLVEELADEVHVFGRDHRLVRSGPPESILSDHPFLLSQNLVHIHVHRHTHGAHQHEHGHAAPHAAKPAKRKGKGKGSRG
jgi:cobalt/nickel transport system ATP-binding protein